MKKYIYLFEEGNEGMKKLLGGKGANLAKMTNIGFPVPPGFIISTEACKEWYANNNTYPKNLDEQIRDKLKLLEEKVNKKFGDRRKPLLLSVRSGAPVSMPGMMNTVLNLGLNAKTVIGLINKSGNERFAYDCYRRFIQVFGNVVLGIKINKFEDVLNAIKKEYGMKSDVELNTSALREIIDEFMEIIAKEIKKFFQEDPYKQLNMCVEAVFRSWNSKRAITYRRMKKIPSNLYTAVIIQYMIFGNTGDDSGTGVAFTRNPSTGEKEYYGEYLSNAQGEDIVSGIRTPSKISNLKEELPKVWKDFVRINRLLEKYYRDVQDFEFTIEKGKFYILQTRNAKRTPQAAVKIAVDMAKEGIISKEEAILRVERTQLVQLLQKRVDAKAEVKVIAKGLPASPGVATGMVVFDVGNAERMNKEEKKAILVRTDTNPNDIHGMIVAEGILTSKGGMSSHAAIIAREINKCCVTGCEAINIDYEAKKFTVGDTEVYEGDIITLDGSAGRVILGKAPIIQHRPSEELQTLMNWVDKVIGAEKVAKKYSDKLVTAQSKLKKARSYYNVDALN